MIALRDKTKGRWYNHFKLEISLITDQLKKDTNQIWNKMVKLGKKRSIAFLSYLLIILIRTTVNLE